MGLLSFLTAKKPEFDTAGTQLKGQAYDSTAPSLPPIRGTLPVPGNGPNALGSLTRSDFGLGPPSPYAASDRSAAPAPVIPLFRDESFERPSTAPENSPPLPASQWTRPPNRLRKDQQRETSHLTSLQGSRTHGSSGDDVLAAPSSRIPDEPPRLTLRHVRTDSARTFIDILDAQSEIKPLDFKRRVQATGAKDYGEDVADRNIAVNGVDINSPQVQKFYATAVNDAANSALPYDHTRSTFLKDIANSTLPSARPSHFPSAPSPLVTKENPKTRPRTKSLNSASYNPPSKFSCRFVAEPVGFFPQDDVLSHSKAIINYSAMPIRHKSLNSHNTNRASAALATANQASVRPLNIQKGGMSREFVTHPSVDPLDQTAAPAHGARVRRSRSPVELPIAKQMAKPQSEFITVVKRNTGSPIPDLGHEEIVSDDPRSIERPSNERSSRKSSLSKRESGSSSSFASTPRATSKRHSLHSFHPSTASSIASREMVAPFTPLSYPRDRTRRVRGVDDVPEVNGVVSAAYFEGCSDVDVDPALDAAPSPSVSAVKIRHFRLTERREGSHGNRKMSLTRSKPGDIPEVPALPHSNCNCSVSSTTPTTSSSGSNPFPRPHSRHTANTSLDMSHKTLSSITSSSSSSLSDADGIEPYRNLVSPPQQPAKPVNIAANNDNFNLDDYISSDTDSFITEGPRGAGEADESLLFSVTGYGLEGDQLPGIPDPPAKAVGGAPPGGLSYISHGGVQHIPRSVPSASLGRFLDPYGGGLGVARGRSGGHATQRRYIIDVDADDYDDEGEDDGASGSEDEYYSEGDAQYYDDERHDLSLSPAPPLRGAGGLRVVGSRLSAIGTGSGPATAVVGARYGYSYGAYGYHPDDIIEEERDPDKVDVAAAVRMRKEAKARQRARQLAGAGRRRGRGRPRASSGASAVGGFRPRAGSGVSAVGGFRRKEKDWETPVGVVEDVVVVGETDAADADEENNAE